MVWQAEIRPATFRGIAFFIARSEGAFGQRGVPHEFPNRDIPYFETLGRKARRFTVTGYVIGSDYTRQKDRMLKACQARNPGELVHPYYGTQQVVCESLNVIEAPRDGGRANFQFVFVEAGELRFPVRSENALGSLKTQSDALSDAAGGEFTDTYSVTGVSGFVRDSVRSKVRNFTTFMEARSRGLGQTTDSVNDLSFQLRGLNSDIETIIASPSLLQSSLKNSISLLASSALDFGRLFDESEKGFEFGANDLVITKFVTPNRTQLQKNDDIINRYVRTEFAIQAAIAGAQVDHASLDEALLKREGVNAQFDALAVATTDDDVYQNIVSTQARVVQSIPLEEEQLPQVVDLYNRVTKTSLSLTYQIYGDLQNEQDVIDRNRIMHPGFVMGGRNLKVLSDA